MTDFAARRRMMVDTQVRPSDVTKYPIIDAMLSVPREMFVPDALRDVAYAGEDLELEGGRVLLEPRTLAKMLETLDLGEDDLVMDIGSAFGYSAAVIARLAQAVIAVEEDEAMAGEAQALLSQAGADNAVVHQGPLAAGAAEHGPYDVIIIEGGIEEVPTALLDQLKDGGRMACIFLEGALGEVRIGYKSGNTLTWRFEFNAAAPILPGFRTQQAFAL
ncbi:protein-L-isoaspartate O-methyltransferase family protein [Antarcticimicrobium sediminis]|uniref:Protein-L-isoaspartate O-methyltransferase n=1 Tax=Antarcticimicrobium sediminis TaxID=2546227 RepID=A0A4R5F176_9RHOB|nr:protein-L-isoaspartate O-methyltransferase [Antarcticimicrobium sediminis]TDE41171.1 protein-L-isoaspartate O-methyltransferase [Antarcticimicrobium sediminis]